ncbi:hypothetical protein OBBRIDRAFT_797462 [Obba rivulosa]|uniref:Uncharacterized protein n=1 Tax=Obba rivulosa TaxID=1052685 RepID=A0A8E2AL36_9APHY|nr:hypothetical protein OBBRIDRAFT_797462 [Obba rivulosa]
MPSENEALRSKLLDSSVLHTEKFWFSKQMLLRLLILGFVVCVVLMFTEFRRRIASALSPAADWMHR